MKRWWSEVVESYCDGYIFKGRWYGIYCTLYYIFHIGVFLRLLCKVFGHKLRKSEYGDDLRVTATVCMRCGRYAKKTIY